MSKKIAMLLCCLAALGAYVLVRLGEEPPPGREPTVLERLLPPLPVPEPATPAASRSTPDSGRADEIAPYAAGLGAAAEALLGPLDGGGAEGALATWKNRAAGDASPAGRAAYRAVRELEEVAQRRRTALANLERLERREFRSFDQDGAEKKKDFFAARMRSQWDDYAASIRPRINRALAAVRAAEP